MNSEHYVLFGLIASGRDDAGTHSIALALFAVQARRVGDAMDADGRRRYVLNGSHFTPSLTCPLASEDS